jgi:hypothetical protein
MQIFPTTRTDRKLPHPRWIPSLLAAMLSTLTGCGGSQSLPAYHVYEVKGQVLLANGKPLPGGWIYLVPKGDLPVTPSGVIGSDGSFSIVTGGSGEGAPPGDYKVRVESPQFQPVLTKSARKPIFPIKYTDEDSSGLLVTVKADSNRLDPILLK